MDLVKYITEVFCFSFKHCIFCDPIGVKQFIALYDTSHPPWAKHLQRYKRYEFWFPCKRNTKVEQTAWRVWTRFMCSSSRGLTFVRPGVEPRQEMFNGEYSRNNLIYLVRSRALGGGTNDGKTVLNISVRMLVCHQRKSDETQAGGWRKYAICSENIVTSRYHTQGNLKEGKVNANTKLEINAAVFSSAKICANCNIIFVDFKTTFLYPRHCLT